MPHTLLPLLIFLARVCDVTLGTFRTLCVVRGRVALAWLLGFVEVTIWVEVVRQVLTSLDGWTNVLAYALGFATGSAVGIHLERRLAIGDQVVGIVSRARGEAIAAALRREGHCVTELDGRGSEGAVKLLCVLARRRQVPGLQGIAEALDPDCLVVVEDARSTNLHRPAGSVLAPRSSGGLLARVWRA